MSARSAALSCLAAAALAGCDVAAARAPGPPASRAAAGTPAAAAPAAYPTPLPAAPASPRALTATPPRAGHEVAIPAGTLRLGSPSGSALRNAAREADHVQVTLPAFAIDALPYPNDPALPPRASVSRDEAAGLCAQQQKRLCSELEWERACKGDVDASYPLDPRLGSFDPALCARAPSECPSPLGVFALGTLGREWTQSRAGRADWDRLRSASVRGASRDAPTALHRCAARDAAAPESRSESLLFRCCRGQAPSAEYPEQPDLPAFRGLELSNDDARARLSQLPETRAFATDFRLARADATGEALAGRSAESVAPWQLAGPALAWSPLRGEELVVLSGDTKAGALVVAYYPLAEGGARFAGSYLTRDEHVPILVAYKSDVRDELLYSTCWGCGGEGGALRLSDRAQLRFMPR
jgi:formylglycine-generating enzyme required for sulfatase activity